MALNAIAELGARNVLIGHGAGAFALFREDRRTQRFEAQHPAQRAARACRRGRLDARGLPRCAGRRAVARGGVALRRRDRRGGDAGARRRPLRRARGGAARAGRDVRAVEPVSARTRHVASGRSSTRYDRYGRRAQPRAARAPPLARAEVREGGPHLRRRAARPGGVARPPERRLDRDAADALDPARDPDRLGGDGHGDRGAARDRARARGRARHRPPQPLDRGAGRGGRQGEAQRVRDDRRAGDAAARRARVRRARADGALQGQRRPDHRRRRRARRHPHEPRPPLRERRRRSRCPR